MQDAGFSPRESGEVACPFSYPDEDTALRAICSSGVVVRAVRNAGEARVSDAIRASLAPYRTAERTGPGRLRQTANRTRGV